MRTKILFFLRAVLCATTGVMVTACGGAAPRAVSAPGSQWDLPEAGVGASEPTAGPPWLAHVVASPGPTYSSPEECARRRSRRDYYRAELDASKLADAGYARDHCQLTVRRDVDTLTGWSGAPQRAWICDGKLVDSSVESVHTQWMAVRWGDQLEWLKDHCPAESKDEPSAAAGY